MSQLSHLLGHALAVGGKVFLHLSALHVLLEQALALRALDVASVFTLADQFPQGQQFGLWQVHHDEVLIILQRLQPGVHVGAAVVGLQTRDVGR